jgi:hypothetical protein
MAKQQSRGKAKSGAKSQGTNRRGKKAGLKLKDLDAKSAGKVRGGGTRTSFDVVQGDKGLQAANVTAL